MTISLMVTAKDALGISEFLKANEVSIGEIEELRLVVTGDGRLRGQANLSNWFKRSALGQVCGVVHADTIFRPGDFGILARAAKGGKICGLVGASEGVQGRDPIQKIVWGSSLDQEALVSTVDGCSVFFAANVPLEFDEKIFPAWHCVNEDFSLSAAKAGYKIVVPPVHATHRGESTFKPAWQAEYRKYRKLLDEKWVGTVFETT